MKSPRKTLVRSSLTAAALALAGTALVVTPATAAADPASPAGPLLETTCSFEQIDAAMHVTTPQLAQRLDENPERKAQVEAFFELPVAERQGALEQFLAAHQRLQERREELRNSPRADEFQAKAQEIADTCHNY
ncbi:hemophore-related protein [Antrihabitans sp. YC2-6]|uniref:hemophore-related protein n=1 Tax=Antrihabitans sp. YC2-6 TaxID=2799498 RepID=UPI0018F289B0|nr:hemophore-related protein [Antrihabitans sp. YC2-6]MBJ8344188.1 hemophore-related protein [Antrihabitans sp. YC2-6]